MGQVFDGPARSALGVVEMENRNLGKKAAYGILGGIVGGLVFGALMAAAGALPLVAGRGGGKNPIDGCPLREATRAWRPPAGWPRGRGSSRRRSQRRPPPDPVRPDGAASRGDSR